MCIKCSKLIAQAIKNGMPEEDAIDWLWENTAFPVGEPTKEQIKELIKISKKVYKD